MLLTFVISGLFLLSAAFFLWSVLAPALRTNGQEPQQVDLQSFLNLLDPSQQEYLRASTSRAEYRELLRYRRRALAAYLQSMARNSALALRVADAVLAATPTREMEVAALRLTNAALETRTYAISGLLFLRLGSLLPGEAVRLRKAAERYQVLSKALAGRAFVGAAQRA